MIQPGSLRKIYAAYLLFAVITAYVTSQASFFVMLVTIAALLFPIFLWRKRRPNDFRIPNYLPRVFVSLMCALVFFAGYLIVGEAQPANYRREDLAALAITSVVLAAYFAFIRRKTAS